MGTALLLSGRCGCGVGGLCGGGASVHAADADVDVLEQGWDYTFYFSCDRINWNPSFCFATPLMRGMHCLCENIIYALINVSNRFVWSILNPWPMNLVAHSMTMMYKQTSRPASTSISSVVCYVLCAVQKTVCSSWYTDTRVNKVYPIDVILFSIKLITITIYCSNGRCEIRCLA